MLAAKKVLEAQDVCLTSLGCLVLGFLYTGFLQKTYFGVKFWFEKRPHFQAHLKCSPGSFPVLQWASTPLPGM